MQAKLMYDISSSTAFTPNTSLWNDQWDSKAPITILMAIYHLALSVICHITLAYSAECLDHIDTSNHFHEISNWLIPL